MPQKTVISVLHSLPGCHTVEHKGLVWASSARSKNIVHDFVAVTRTLAGGESHAYRRMMNEARKDVLHELVRQAEALGANAILGLTMSSTQIMPATIDLYAYGSAVVVEKEKRK